MEEKKYGYMLVNPDVGIEHARSQATYEETLNGKLLAVEHNWTYVPLGVGEMIDQIESMMKEGT